MYSENSIKRLCQVHGTPLYIYSPTRIKKAVDEIRTAFPGFEIIYSVKTNPFEPVLQLLKDLNVGIDAASPGEAISAARLGHRDIYYSAPGKKPSDIQKGLGVAHVIADSINEIALLQTMAESKGTCYEIGVRLNLPCPGLADSKFEVMGGTASKFGIDWYKLRSLQINKNLKITGLHVYSGSQLLDVGLIADNFNRITQAATEMQARFPIRYINYGGGFGVPYETHEQPLNLRALASQVQDPPKGIRPNLELGRFLVAEAGLFVSMVTDIKHTDDVTYVMIDGGMNAFFRPKFTGQTHRVSVLGKDNLCQNVKLVGNTCTPLDVSYEEITLPLPEVGDILVFENAGAYGYSMSLLDFISFDKPVQVMEDF